MSYALLILLIVGTVWRVTRFVVADTLAEPVRTWIKAKAIATTSRKVWHWLDDLIVCPWCVSIWVGAATVAVADAIYSVPAPVFVWLTASGATGFLITVEPD